MASLNMDGIPPDLARYIMAGNPLPAIILEVHGSPSGFVVHTQCLPGEQFAAILDQLIDLLKDALKKIPPDEMAVISVICLITLPETKLFGLEFSGILFDSGPGIRLKVSGSPAMALLPGLNHVLQEAGEKGIKILDAWSAIP